MNIGNYKCRGEPENDQWGGGAVKKVKKAPRYYTVTSSSAGKPGGRYASKSGPKAAAGKAASKRFSKSGGPSTLTLTIRENGTTHTFAYKAKRVKLAKPFVRTIGGKTITSEYRVDVEPVNK